MTLKNKVQPDHASVNAYELVVAGLPPLTFTKVSGLEDETETVDLPDRTSASGGQSKPFDITAEMPVHHTAEMAAMEEWLQEGRDPVQATYKKTGTMIYKTIGGNVAKSYTLAGMQCKKQKLPDAEMENEGDVSLCEWTFRVDEKFPA